MTAMTLGHYIGAIIGILTVIGAGVLSGIRSSRKGISTSGERALGTFSVSTSAIGILVGGASTIGTAQLAYIYGFSAWWFTLGVGLACLSLLVFRKPFYDSHVPTLTKIVTGEYGGRSGTLTALLMSAGSFIAVVSQMLSGVALVTSVSAISDIFAGLVVAVVMISYIIFGGMRGSSATGLIKCILLYSCCVACGFIVLTAADGGWAHIRATLPAEQYFNLFARGFATDFGAGLSVVLGVLTTQAYFQVFVMSKNKQVYNRTCIVGTVLIPPVGVATILVGMYMKINYPTINPRSALPLFIMEKFPPVFAGICLGGILITLVGTGAGLTAGIANNFAREFYKVYIKPDASQKQLSFVTNACIAIVPLLPIIFVVADMGDLISTWSFLALGLRGAGLFAPLCAAIWLPGKCDTRYAQAAIIIGPIVTILSQIFLPLPVDSVFPGIAAAGITVALGCRAKKKSA